MRRLLIVLAVAGPVLAAPTTKPAEPTLAELHRERMRLEREIAKLNAELAKVNARIAQRIAAKVREEKALLRSLPRQHFVVSAKRVRTNPLDTGIYLDKGQQFIVYPNLRDRWTGGGTKKGAGCDYRGYGEGSRWMELTWRVGKTDGPVKAGEKIIAPKRGKLLLFAWDQRNADNAGFIRCDVVVIPDQSATAPAAPEPPEPAPGPAKPAPPL